jgi:hypothetical protein
MFVVLTIFWYAALAIAAVSGIFALGAAIRFFRRGGPGTVRYALSQCASRVR